MDKRAARREARTIVASYARSQSSGVDASTPDGERLSAAFADLAEFLDPAPLVVPVDPDQLSLDVGGHPEAGG